MFTNYKISNFHYHCLHRSFLYTKCFNWASSIALTIYNVIYTLAIVCSYAVLCKQRQSIFAYNIGIQFAHFACSHYSGSPFSYNLVGYGSSFKCMLVGN